MQWTRRFAAASIPVPRQDHEGLGGQHSVRNADVARDPPYPRREDGLRTALWRRFEIQPIPTPLLGGGPIRGGPRTSPVERSPSRQPRRQPPGDGAGAVAIALERAPSCGGQVNSAFHPVASLVPIGVFGLSAIGQRPDGGIHSSSGSNRERAMNAAAAIVVYFRRRSPCNFVFAFGSRK
jgi:hypothetical protein